MRNLGIQMVATSQKRKTRKQASGLDCTGEGFHFNSEIMHGGECDMNEPTISEKLASLQDDDKAKGTTKHEPSTTAMPPIADSIHLLLKQALHAEDSALLLDCLYTRDKKVIAKSTSLLNPAEVLKLLEALISMIESRGAVLACTLPWLKRLLSQHASSIVTQESSFLILNSLCQRMESRISTFESTLELSTCLDCLFFENPDSEAGEDSMAPTIIYEDEDSGYEDSRETWKFNELGTTICSCQDSDGSAVMAD